MKRLYQHAKERYAAWGVDTDAAITRALVIPISLHCWQADDNVGFEPKNKVLSGGGILATGNYPGRARNAVEVRADLAKAISLIPGKQRVNVHSYYAEFEAGFADRDELTPEHFKNWMKWAAETGVALDFNPSFHAHPKAESGFTLSNADASIRRFWVRHGRAARKIAEAMAKAQGSPCNLNFWIPDGAKDIPADRWAPRRRLAESYDRIFSAGSISRAHCVDFVESKLFGIGSEEYVVGSAEFYSNYALTRGVGLCLDMGHFHPTEALHDKLSGHLLFMKRLLLHVSRPIRWDSDHVVIFSDDLKNLFLEIARGNAWNRVALALDFFDASINRVGAYVIGTRATRKAILYALLDPSEQLKSCEREGRNTHRLAIMEEMKNMPFGPVWDMLCARAGVPDGPGWMKEMDQYERQTLTQRC